MTRATPGIGENWRAADAESATERMLIGEWKATALIVAPLRRSRATALPPGVAVVVAVDQAAEGVLQARWRLAVDAELDWFG